MKRLGLFVAVATLVVAGCSEGGETEPEVDSSRIVTLSGDLTEIVYELGSGDRLVGRDVTTIWPEEALDLPVVGVGRFITAEGVLSVDPTLVLGDTQSSPAEALQQIEGAGAAVKLLPVPTDFDGLYAKVESIGSLLGASDEADALVDRLRTDIETAESGAVDTGLRVAYVYTRGPDVLLLFGDGMTTRPLIEAAGGIDAGTDSGVEETVTVSAEALIAAAPDVIIIPTEGLEAFGSVEAFLETPGVKQTPAGQSGAILDYPEGDFLTFGPRIAETLELLAADLARISG